MNKRELIVSLANENKLTQPEAESIIDIFFDQIANALSKSHRIELRGFCTFTVKKYNAYKGRNPKTGDRIKIPSKKLPVFKCGKDLKDRVDMQKGGLRSVSDESTERRLPEGGFASLNPPYNPD